MYLDVLEVFDLVLGAGDAAADGVPLLEGVERVDRAGLDILDLKYFYLIKIQPKSVKLIFLDRSNNT